jgi:hypothetical protein
MTDEEMELFVKHLDDFENGYSRLGFIQLLKGSTVEEEEEIII